MQVLFYLLMLIFCVYTESNSYDESKPKNYNVMSKIDTFLSETYPFEFKYVNNSVLFGEIPSIYYLVSIIFNQRA